MGVCVGTVGGWAEKPLSKGVLMGGGGRVFNFVLFSLYLRPPHLYRIISTSIFPSTVSACSYIYKCRLEMYCTYYNIHVYTAPGQRSLMPFKAVYAWYTVVIEKICPYITHPDSYRIHPWVFVCLVYPFLLHMLAGLLNQLLYCPDIWKLTFCTYLLHLPKV